MRDTPKRPLAQIMSTLAIKSHSGRFSVPLNTVLALVFLALCLYLLAIAPVLLRSPPLHYLLIGYLIIRILQISFNPQTAASLLMLHWFTLFGAVIPLLYQFQGNSFHYAFMSSSDLDILHPLLIVTLFSLSVDAGHFISTRQGGNLVNATATVERQLQPSLWSLSLFVVATNALVAGAIKGYGIDYFLTNRLEQYLDYHNAGFDFFFFNFVMRIALYWCFVITGLITLQSIKIQGLLSWRTTLSASLLLLLTAEMAVFSSPFGAARFLVLGFLLMFAMAFTDMASATMRLGFVTSAAIALYLVFPVLGSAPRANEVVWVLSEAQLTDYLSHLDFDNAPQLLLGYIYSQEQGLMHGWNLLSALLVFVPRSLWPAKSEGLGSIIISYFGVTFTNVSAPMYLEFFMDFSYPGAVVLSLLFGVIIGKVNRTARRKGRFSASWMLNVALFAAMPIIVRGALMTGMSLIYAHLIVIATWALVNWAAIGNPGILSGRLTLPPTHPHS
jgi:hypothetical protein